jgi:hypothetical protein
VKFRTLVAVVPSEHGRRSVFDHPICLANKQQTTLRRLQSSTRSPLQLPLSEAHKLGVSEQQHSVECIPRWGTTTGRRTGSGVLSINKQSINHTGHGAGCVSAHQGLNLVCVRAWVRISSGATTCCCRRGCGSGWGERGQRVAAIGDFLLGQNPAWRGVKSTGKG